MKLSTFTRLMAIIATSLVLTPPTLAIQPFQPTKGAVFGNIDTLEQMSPRVVLHYLARCANVTGYDTLEDSDCLYTNYIDEQFPGLTWGNECSPPDITLESVAANLAVAAGKCSENIANEFLDTASTLIMQVFAMDTCWAELCEREDIHLRLEAEWIETCSGVKLPYPAESAMSMFPTEDEKEDSILTCMLDFIMDTPPFQFGLEDPRSRCYPPGHKIIVVACSSVLAQQAFKSCVDLAYFYNEDDMIMSFEYEMSMKTDQDDEKEESMLFARFCDILEGLSTEQGLKCLEQICQDDTDPSPSSAAPFFAPSSKRPTPPPTKRPTPAPGSPSASPTLPTKARTPPPTKRPTPPPTKRPTPVPGSPSASPTLSELRSIVEVEIVSAFALNVSTSDVPVFLQKTVESGIEDSLSSGGDDVDVTILSVNGSPVTRRLRRLQNTIELEFTVKAIKECYVSDCAMFARNLIENLGIALANSVVDGSMTAYIQQVASTKNITELTSAVVITTSYRYVRSKSQLSDPVIITNPEVVHSSAALVPTVSIFGISCLIVPFLISI